MSSLPLPDTWLDVLGLLIIVGIPSATTVIGLRWQSQRAADKHKELATEVGEVKSQVKNSHDTNLRDDLDEIKASIAEITKAVGEIDRRTVRIGDEVRVDRKEVDRMRRDTYAAIQRYERVISKHHPEDAEHD